MDQQPPVPPSLARFACISCRRSKRKCNRTFPSCTLCQKNGLACEYQNKPHGRSKQLQSPTTTPLTSASSNFDYPSPQKNFAQKFPPVYFLNGNIFRQAGVELPYLDIPIPRLVLDMLEDSETVLSSASEFFNSIHYNFPILAKARFQSQVLNPLLPIRAEKALLIFCMRLVMLYPSAGIQMHAVPDYLIAKQFRAELETAGASSMYFIQASILLCLYEFGHAIYPAAYYSIAAVARHGIAFGMNDIETTHCNQPNWIEQEEIRRSWWAILILDRSVSFGNPMRPLATQEPSASSIIPVVEAAWDSGIAPKEPAYALTPSTSSIGKFGRFAQAICLLGRAYRHIVDRNASAAFLEDEAEQLRRTLRALVELVDLEAASDPSPAKLDHCTTTSICYSTLQILQTAYGSNIASLSSGPEDSRITSLEAVANEGAKISDGFLALMPDAPIRRVSPFIFHFLHQCAVFFIDRLTEDSNNQAALQVLKDILRVLSTRWKAADAYLEITEAYEVMKMA